MQIGRYELCSVDQSLCAYFSRFIRPFSLAVVISIVSTSAFSSPVDHELKICAGKPGGTYIKAAYWLAKKFEPYFSKVSIVESGGSLESHLKMSINECDLGLAQGDSLPYFENQSDQLSRDFSTSRGDTISVDDLNAHAPVSLINELLGSKSGLYLESVHLLCNRELGASFNYRSGLLGRNKVGINSLEDLLAYLKHIDLNGESLDFPKPTIYLGPSGGGAHATYFAIKSLYQELNQANAQAIDESQGLDNGVSAGLFQTFNQPTACFLYVSKSPHKIISTLSMMGGPNGPPNAIDQRIPTLSMSGSEIQRYYFESVKLLSSSTSDLLDMRDPKGAYLFTENEITSEYNNLRMSDAQLDYQNSGYYSEAADSKTLLATPTQIYASGEFFTNSVDGDEEIKNIFKQIIQEAQQRRGSFPEE